MKIPVFLEKYFWDVDFKSLGAIDSAFVAERILEYGDGRAVRWLLDNFTKQQIKQILSKRKGFSRKSANYWSLIFGLPQNKILCLKKSYQKMQKSHWPY
jgi:hypothetical protein